MFGMTICVSLGGVESYGTLSIVLCGPVATAYSSSSLNLCFRSWWLSGGPDCLIIHLDCTQQPHIQCASRMTPQSVISVIVVVAGLLLVDFECVQRHTEEVYVREREREKGVRAKPRRTWKARCKFYYSTYSSLSVVVHAASIGQFSGMPSICLCHSLCMHVCGVLDHNGITATRAPRLICHFVSGAR